MFFLPAGALRNGAFDMLGAWSCTLRRAGSMQLAGSTLQRMRNATVLVERPHLNLLGTDVR